ncbi:MAG: terminase family protein, partial [Deferribacteraceae bacterium]|nr:terminase family protein [Deferribacteraceae bacterium]
MAKITKSAARMPREQSEVLRTAATATQSDTAVCKTAGQDVRSLSAKDVRRSGGILLDYQKRWINDSAPVKVIEKSRRIGVTWAEAIEDTLLAASANGDNVWYIGYNKDMAYEFIQTCAEWAKRWNKVSEAIKEDELIDEDKKILSYSLTFASGYRITALSSRPSNLRGKQGKIVIDEAAFHEDLPELLKAALAMLVWGGRVVIISTHNGEDNLFNELIKDIRAGRLKYSLHKVTFDDAIADGLYEQVCKVTQKSGA